MVSLYKGSYLVLERGGMMGLTALYERLSRDDDIGGESNSIINQKKMLEEYAERQGIKNYIHFSDDGISYR